MVVGFASSVAITGRSSIAGEELCKVRRGVAVTAAPFALRGRAQWAMKVGIFYSTSTGNTQEIAEMMKEKLGSECPDEPIEIEDDSKGKLADYDTIIVGAPTWNTSADEERSGTAMDDFLYDLDDVSLEGRSVACFGLGDAAGYGEYFCDALEEVHDRMATTGARMIGYVDSSYLEYEESKSVRDGKFLGLAVDNVNGDGDEIEAYVGKWCEQVLAESKVPA